MSFNCLKGFIEICGGLQGASTEFKWMIEHLLAKRHRSFFDLSAKLPSETVRDINGLYKHPKLNLHDQIAMCVNLLNPREIQRLEGYLNARCCGKPLQYILGNQQFLGLNLLVRQPVLIPRWETEEWTERLIGLLTSNPRILEIGTGTGCISLAIGHAVPGACITAVDVSPKALCLAEINRRRNRVGNVKFMLGDIMDDEFVSKLKEMYRFDIVVSNPPYVSPDEKLDKQVADWEDPRALFTRDKNGIEFYSRIAQISGDLLTKQSDMPSVALEIGESQGHLVRALFSNFKTELWTDLAGRPRNVVAYHCDERKV